MLFWLQLLCMMCLTMLTLMLLAMGLDFLNDITKQWRN